MIRALLVMLVLYCANANAYIIGRGSGGGGEEPPGDITCSGTIYYVSSSSGSDSNNGTSEGEAWETTAKVSGTSFAAGSCIVFKRGDTWNSRLIVPSSGTAGNPIVFGAYGTGSKPVIDGTGIAITSMYHGMVNCMGKSNVTISDIRVQDSGLGDANNNTGIYIYNSSNIIVDNVEIANTESAGIMAGASTNVSVLNSDVTMTNCAAASEQISFSNIDGFEIAHNKSYTNCNPSYSPPGGAGIDAKGGSRNGSIHHNEVWDIGGGSNGIYVDGYSTSSYNIQIYNNKVWDVEAGALCLGAEQTGNIHDVLVHHNIFATSTDTGLLMHDSGTEGGPVYNIYVYNNTFYKNGTSGVGYKVGTRIFDSLLATGGLILKNNIFAESYNQQVGYDASRVDSSDIVMDYNVVYGTQVNSGPFTALSGTNYIDGNPLFTNAANGDFTLQTGSSAKDVCDNSVWAGVPDVVDYAGTPVTDGSGTIVAPGGTVNCGAFE